MAAAQSEAFSEWHSSINLATREDIQRLEAATKSDLGHLEDRMQARFAEVNQRIAEKAADTIKWVIGMSVAQAGLVIAVLKMHP